MRREHGKYNAHQLGLRTISKPVWDDMLAIVKCTVLNVIKNEHVDAYLLRYFFFLQG
jgi:S-adenosylmethionine decarboxylase